jgi:tape measure domain-containing protein
MANGRIGGEDLIEESVFERYARLDAVVQKQIERMNALEVATRAALGGKGIASSAGEAEAAVKKGNTALTEQEKVLREITRLKERNTQVSKESLRQVAEERTKRSQLNRLLKDESILNSALTSSYQKLRKQRDLAANTLRDLVASEKASNRELRKAQKEFERLNAKVKKADSAIGNFRDNVGNYGSAVQGVLGFSRQLLSAFGLFSSIQIAQQIFEQIKALDALRFGLELVTESQEAFNQAQFFIDELADRAGADLLVLTGRYTNFLAAAKTTTLTLAETQRVFENIVVAGSALGRSTDDTNGALRALEQILSKGKVQAEELRGQLGERLPGAFQILEKALGLANGELNELLEVGGLLSVEAIPALADGLEDAFGLDVLDRVENLVTAQQRLGNEWNIFIRGVADGNGVISVTLRFLFDGLSSVVRLLQELNGQSIIDARAAGLANGYAVAIEAVENTAKQLNITFAEAAEQLIPSYNRVLKESGEVLQEVTEAQSGSAIKNAFNQLTGKFDEQQETAAVAVETLSLYGKGLEALMEILATGKLPEEVENVTDAAIENSNTLEGLRASLKLLRAEFETTDIETPRFGVLKGEISDLEERIKSLTGAYRENKEKLDEIIDYDSIVFVAQLEGGLEKLRGKTEVGSAAWVKYGRELEGVRERLKELTDLAGLLDGDLSTIELFDDEEIDVAREVEDFLNTDGLDLLLGNLATRFKKNKEEIVDEFIDQYGRDFDKFVEFEKKKTEAATLEQRARFDLTAAGLDLGDELAQAFQEVQIKRIDEEGERQNKIFDNIVNNKESSEEAIAQAEKDKQLNEEKLDAKRAKAEQKAFIFRQAISVGDIFLADALARANAVAASARLGLILGAATLATLNGLISTTTAIALATVAAQSIPQFFYKGKGLGDNYEGPGIWGELRREVKVGKEGQLEVSPDGASPTFVKSSDIILKSLGDFKNKMGSSNSEVSQRVRRGIKRTSDTSMNALMTPSKDRGGDKELEQILAKAVAKGLSRARLSPRFNIYSDVKIRKVP